MTQKQPDGRDRRGRSGETAQSFHALSEPVPLSNVHVLTTLETLQTPFGFLWRLHDLGMID